MASRDGAIKPSPSDQYGQVQHIDDLETNQRGGTFNLS